MDVNAFNEHLLKFHSDTEKPYEKFCNSKPRQLTKKSTDTEDDDPQTNINNTETNMAALTGLQVIKAVADAIKEPFSGKDPKALGPSMDNLQLLGTNIDHASNQAGLMAAIKTRVIGDARDAFPEEGATIESISAAMRRACKTRSIKEIKAQLHNIEFHNKEIYLSSLQETQSELKQAYIKAGSNVATAEKLATEDVQEHITTNFPNFAEIQGQLAS